MSEEVVSNDVPVATVKKVNIVLNVSFTDGSVMTHVFTRDSDAEAYTLIGRINQIFSSSTEKAATITFEDGRICCFRLCNINYIEVKVARS